MEYKINGFSNYLINKSGEVFSKFKNRKLKPYIGRYISYVLVDDSGKSVPMGRHRILALLFIPNPLNKSDVNHKNGNKHDNEIKNLEWNTRPENIKHSYDVIKRDPPNMKSISQVKDGEIIKEYKSISDVSKAGYSRTAVSNCLNGVCKTSSGYEWRFN